MNVVTPDASPWFDSRVAAVLRVLAMDAVEKAKSGHPGAPMGLAEVAAVLWRIYLRHNPANPAWPDRDRFVLSNGHASILLYALLHLTGYDLPLNELKRFRQLHSKAPGHPEFGLTPGVETTTGPLGQGFANAVGMAIAEKTLAAQFNRAGHAIVDHRTFVIVSDGCLMEGISHEAASLAGRLGLGKLITIYDDNGVSIDGKVAEWFADNTPKRFEAYGWHVIPDINGHDPVAIDEALAAAIADDARPSLLCCKTVIGRGPPTKLGNEDSHGVSLGRDEVARARVELDWSCLPFDIPASIAEAWDARRIGAELEADWNERLERYAAVYPDLAVELRRRINGALPASFVAVAERCLATAVAKGETQATRKSGQNVLGAFAEVLPELLGGSADLAHTNLTTQSLAGPITRAPTGNNIFFGMREFGMTAIANGIALHGGFIPYVATFLVLSDYARNAVRMSALMGQRIVHIYTHDSIGLGEDGPTHQPVEHVESLRLIPNLNVWRPCDAVETAAAWRSAIIRTSGPTALLLSRQALSHQVRSPEQINAISRGGYVLIEPAMPAVATIVATGSEVQLACAAASLLAAEQVSVRVVSMPCVEMFESQADTWQRSVLPLHLPVVAVEAGATRGWHRYVGRLGEVIGIDRFGKSAPAATLFAHFGFTPERIADAVLSVIARCRSCPIC